MATIHVVSHAHWDREWYLPAVRFRQLLVGMVDDLLDDPPGDGASFLLDGQTVLIDDYLAVRPEREAELVALLRSGALEAGPWFVQADELIPSGESLVRNLLAGARTLRVLGVKAPPVMYCPDTFGHPAALPILARGFGCGLAIASRGYGGTRWPAGDAVWWVGPDGERVLFYHLSRSGYETGAHLPTDAAEAAARWQSMRADLVPRSALDTVLLMNGADHHARQAHLREATAALADAARPDDVRASSLTSFAHDITVRAIGAPLPEVRGELRDSYGWMWTLQGTFATRAHQKRRNATLERLLIRDAEPWAAIAARLGAGTRRPAANAAWRSLLLCHPHDTICGCSIDEVARAMDARLDEADSQGCGLRTDALHDVIGHDTAAARVRRDEWVPLVIVRNRAARTRGGVAILRLTAFVADVKVGIHPDAPAAPPSPRTTPAVDGASHVQVLARADAIELTESPQHYPDADLVAVTEVAAWIPEVPPYGVRALRQTSRGSRAEFPNPVLTDGTSLRNGLVSVRIDDDGAATFADAASDRTLARLFEWESHVDRGDLYTPSLRGPALMAQFGGARTIHKGPVRGVVETKWTFRGKPGRVDARLQVLVDADTPWMRARISGVNAATDHRLRLRIATGLSRPSVFADATFGVAERITPAVTEVERAMEWPLQTAPLHRYVSVFSGDRGVTVLSDGLGEYEVDEHGNVFVTLIRAVGELSRGDLPERPGNAGWPTPTPQAQCPGAFGAEIAVMCHGARTAATIHHIECAADDVLLPLEGATLRSALAVPGPIHGIALEGDGLAFLTAKESDDGRGTVLRCVNLLGVPVAGRWALASRISEAHQARLDETPLHALPTDGNAVAFTAKPHEVVTILAT